MARSPHHQLAFAQLLQLCLSTVVNCVVCVCAAGVARVGEGIRQLSVGEGGDAALRGRDSQRRGAMRYVGPDTRPQHVTNTQGHIHAVL